VRLTASGARFSSAQELPLALLSLLIQIDLLSVGDISTGKRRPALRLRIPEPMTRFESRGRLAAVTNPQSDECIGDLATTENLARRYARLWGVISFQPSFRVSPVPNSEGPGPPAL
jgi:hypothetical protein